MRGLSVKREVAMPFSGHSCTELSEVLNLISRSSLRLELFDAFLAEYARTQCLKKAMFFARSEWDC